MANLRPVIIFGASSFASLVSKYIERFTDWEICGYTADRAYCQDAQLDGKPLIPFDELSRQDAENWDAVLAVGYSVNGDVRRHAYRELKQTGFTVRNFIHPTCECYADEIGEGNLLLENTVIGFGATLGDANLIWTGANIGHDDCIGSFCTMCATTSFGGFTKVGDNCFFGMNATVRDHLNVAPYTFVGAGACLTHDTDERDVYVSRGTSRVSREEGERIRMRL